MERLVAHAPGPSFTPTLEMPQEVQVLQHAPLGSDNTLGSFRGCAVVEPLLLACREREKRQELPLISAAVQ